MYTLREFRANTKQAFDDAYQGHEVVITRGKDVFQLISLVDGALPGHLFESQPGKEAVLVELGTVKDPNGDRVVVVKETALKPEEKWSGPLYRDKKKAKL